MLNDAHTSNRVEGSEDSAPMIPRETQPRVAFRRVGHPEEEATSTSSSSKPLVGAASGLQEVQQRDATGNNDNAVRNRRMGGGEAGGSSKEGSKAHKSKCRELHDQVISTRQADHNPH